MQVPPPGKDDAGSGPREAPGVLTRASRLSVDQALRRAVVKLEELGLELFAMIDHSGKAAEVGLTMPDTKLLVFGAPKGGTPLMLAHPLIALDLPLKLLIWENDDHDAFVSYNAPSYLAERFGLSKLETEATRVVEVIVQAVVGA